MRLYDSNCVYRKTVCRFGNGMNQTDARAFCQSYGGQLYAILTDLDYDLLEIYVGKTSTFPGAFVINGIQAANGSWIVYNPNPQPLFSEAIPSGSGCLFVRTEAGPKIIIQTDACSRSCNFFCEFY